MTAVSAAGPGWRPSPSIRIIPNQMLDSTGKANSYTVSFALQQPDCRCEEACATPLPSVLMGGDIT
jgi:hypothetical protein